MIKVHYRPARLAGWAMLWMALGALSFLEESAVSQLVGAALLATGVLAGSTAFDPRPALVTTSGGVTVRTLWGERFAPWSELLLVTIDQARPLGPLSMMKRRYLSIMVSGGALGSKRLRLMGSWLNLPPGGLDKLRDNLLAARAAAGATADLVEGRVASGEFDPDAAIARYLEAKRLAPGECLEQPRSEPVLQRAARPTFGKRVV